MMFALTVRSRKVSGAQVEELAKRLLQVEWTDAAFQDDESLAAQGTTWAFLLERTEDGEGAVLSVESGGQIVRGQLGLWNRGLAPDLRRRCMDLQDAKQRIEEDAEVAKILGGIG
jgi:hypothetical protein